MFIIFLVLYVVSLFYDAFVSSPALHGIFHTTVAQYSLFVLNNYNYYYYYRCRD